MKRSRIAFVFSFLALATCGRDSLDPTDKIVEAVVVSPPVTTVAIGASVNLSAEVLGLDGIAMEDRPVHWASEDITVATVAPNGTVTARGLGATQIAASTGGRSGIAQITVVSVPVASVQVTPGNRSLFVGQTFQFTAMPRDGSGGALADRTVEWTSNNESVATVSATGLVTALSPGGAIIFATAEGKSSPASVTVAAVPVASVVITPATPSLVEGQTAQLQAEPRDEDGGPLVDRVVQWTTTNPAVATVTSTGLVTALAQGEVTIRATVEGKTGTNALTVGPRPPNAVVLTPGQVLVQPGKTSQLTVQVLDDLGRELPNISVTFNSSDPGIATVGVDGLVTGVNAGSATITATSGGKSGTAQVTVTPVPVSLVVVSPPTPTMLIGRDISLTAQAYSATGQLLSGRSITWSSSTPSVASVSQSGTVTALAAGSTVIFASVDGVQGWATVTVVPTSVSTVTVTPATATIGVTGTATYTAELRDSNGNILNGRVVGWSSSDENIASISATGVATGVGTGTATITAASEGRTGTATIVVAGRIVQVLPDSVALAPFTSTTLSVIVTDAGVVVKSPSVTWSSSNGLVASVNQKGRVSAFLPGMVTITARVGSASGTATVVVR